MSTRCNPTKSMGRNNPPGKYLSEKLNTNQYPSRCIRFYNLYSARISGLFRKRGPTSILTTAMTGIKTPRLPALPDA